MKPLLFCLSRLIPVSPVLVFPAMFFQVMFFSAHGFAETTQATDLNIYINTDQNNLAINFSVPAKEMLGFENKPRNPFEKQLLQTTLDTLSNSRNIIRLEGGQCRQVANKSRVIDLGRGVQAAFTPGYAKIQHQHTSKCVHPLAIGSWELQCKQAASIHQVSLSMLDQFPQFRGVKISFYHSKGFIQRNLDADNKSFQVRR